MTLIEFKALSKQIETTIRLVMRYYWLKHGGKRSVIFDKWRKIYLEIVKTKYTTIWDQSRN